MPAKSQKQRGYIYANKGAAWAKAHGYDNKGKLPTRVKPKTAKRARTKRKGK